MLEVEKARILQVLLDAIKVLNNRKGQHSISPRFTAYNVSMSINPPNFAFVLMIRPMSKNLKVKDFGDNVNPGSVMRNSQQPPRQGYIRTHPFSRNLRGALPPTKTTAVSLQNKLPQAFILHRRPHATGSHDGRQMSRISCLNEANHHLFKVSFPSVSYG
jgi:hypothetical protein